MKVFRFLSFLFFITLYSCNQGPDFEDLTSDTTLEQIAQKSEKEIPEEKSPVDRKVIKEGDISFETGDAKEIRQLFRKAFLN